MHKELVDAVVAERGFLTEFSSEAEQQAAQAAEAVAQAADDGRHDIRDQHLITIDGEDAHDFDDAVGCRRLADGGMLLSVAIADVSAFVPPASALDAAAAQRGNSVYLPGRVLPMLPPVLSNNACSLRPHEDRLALCCEMDFSAAAELRQYRFFRAVMRSAARLNYEDAAAQMHGAQEETPLALLWALAEQLRDQRARRGGMLLEKPEKVCTLTAADELKVQILERNIAHWAIEEAMIAANRCAADFLIQQRRPALHRIHNRPTAEKVQQLAEALAPLGIALPPKPQASDFAIVLRKAEKRDPALADALTPLVLGTLARAEYAADEKTGHFGLACPRYTHFTSPIRRYPDLLTHRAIIAALDGAPSPLAAGELAEIGAHCGEQEVRADKAGWDSRQRLLCVGAQAVIGCDYEGYVSGVAPMGFFVYVKELGIDGMVRLATLPGYWRSDVNKRTVTAPDNSTVIRMADKINVRLDAVSPEKGRAELSASDYRRR